MSFDEVILDTSIYYESSNEETHKSISKSTNITRNRKYFCYLNFHLVKASPDFGINACSTREKVSVASIISCETDIFCLSKDNEIFFSSAFLM